MPRPHRPGGGRGSGVSPGGLLENQLVEGEVGDDLSELAVLALELFQALGLGGGHPAELLAPAVVGDVTDTQGFDDLCKLLPLPEQDIGVAELSDDLFGLEPLLGYDLPPLGKGSIAILPLDQFPGARSIWEGDLARPHAPLQLGAAAHHGRLDHEARK
jgi:hypothetical protein